ncbi:DELLA protein RGL1-like [Rhodamnia argentea]|uniref:DELLA protein RGL1-like n=1 Tax=Rhodamnia argentea TaxID=178133 RepID=A0A8B8QAF0_9MYRT|nr:DELLA protein RGL1-like [Rhodamnia argentea]
MANVSFSFRSFGFDQGCVPEDRDKEERVAKGVQEHRGEDVAVLNPFFSGFGSQQENLSNQGVRLPDQSQLGSKSMILDQFNLNVSYPATSGSEESPEFGNKQKTMMPPSSKATLELLSNYWTVVKKSKRDDPVEMNREVSVSQPKLSAEEIMKVAGTRYIQFQHQRDNHFSMLTHPFGPAFSGLSEDDLKEVELAQLLLAAAEKVGDQQFDRASRLLSYCELLASKRASPAQRIVLYFVEALQDRIDKETGRMISAKGCERKAGKDDMSQGLSTSLISLKCHAQLPFNQVTQFTALQVILEQTLSATRIHLIDLQIRSGIQWIVLMQALAERKGEPVELLKITAVGSAGRAKMEEAGKRLASVAESMNIPFSFQLLFLPNLEDIREEQFNLEDGEAIAVYAPMVLRTMISRPTSLEKMISVVRNLNPSVMVMTEVEANHNSPSFVTRFIEALFFYSAYFDCLEACMTQETEYKTIVEEIFSIGIRNIVSTEGHERVTRNVKIEVWRAFFARYRMVELELSEASLYQATLVTKQFACERFCTLNRDGNCLLVGWKGTPILSLSAWKFW